MGAKRFLLRCAVNLILLENEKVLLLLRGNTGFGDGNYGVIGGHIDGDETAREAVIREAQEEVNIHLNPECIKFVGTIHRKLSHCEYIDLFFVAESWSGLLENKEPVKHVHYKWFELNSLPHNTMPLVNTAISNYVNGIFYDELGWDE
ncbi:nucleoside triphosphate pyrophosphohydrolase [compost metagenome]